MKIITNFKIFPAKVPKRVYEELGKIHPDGKKPFSFSCFLPEADTKVQKLVCVLRDAGIMPQSYGEAEKKNRFYLELIREYDPQDIEEAKLLQFLHQYLSSHSSDRNSDGVIELEPEFLKKNHPLAMHGLASVISDEFKAAMEKAGLMGAVFKPTGVKGEPGKVGKTGYWELTSNTALPAMPTEMLVCRNNQPFKGDYAEVVGIRGEPFYRGAELHYSRAKVEKMKPFDIAHTFESFCNEPRLVVSQKFRAFCKQQKLKLTWEPVRLDP